MEQTYTGFGYILLKFEPDASNEERKRTAEEMVRLGNGNIQAVEFPRDWIFYNSRTYDAAARFESPNEERAKELANEIGKLKGVKKDSSCIRYMANIKPFFTFKELEQLAVVK
jgi:hypothetical protein